MTKPAGNLPTWNTGLANNTEPNGAKKTLGWEVNEKPASSYFNWWQNKVGEWVSYLNGLAAEAFTWTGLQTFERTVTSLPGAGAGTNEDAAQFTGKGTGYALLATQGDNTGTAVKTVGRVEVTETGAFKANAFTPLTNEIAHRTTIKLHVHITTNGTSGITAHDGANVMSGGVTLQTANRIRVEFAAALTNTSYTVVPIGVHIAAAREISCAYINRTMEYFELEFRDYLGAVFDFSANTSQVDVIVIGVQ